MGDHAGNCHRDARGGHGQEQIVSRHHLLIEAEALTADHVCEGDPVEDADHLANQAGDAENGDAANQAALSVCHMSSLVLVVTMPG